MKGLVVDSFQPKIAQIAARIPRVGFLSTGALSQHQHQMSFTNKTRNDIYAYSFNLDTQLSHLRLAYGGNGYKRRQVIS